MARKESLKREQLELVFKRRTRKDETWETKELDRGNQNSPRAESEH
jgi:hypothetical protein